jgi:hypothetical protein
VEEYYGIPYTFWNSSIPKTVITYHPDSPHCFFFFFPSFELSESNKLLNTGQAARAAMSATIATRVTYRQDRRRQFPPTRRLRAAAPRTPIPLAETATSLSSVACRILGFLFCHSFIVSFPTTPSRLFSEFGLLSLMNPQTRTTACSTSCSTRSARLLR